jgi:aminoglycoside phosphotransferase family enzyme
VAGSDDTKITDTMPRTPAKRRRAARSDGSGGRHGRTVKKSVTLREKTVREIEARTGARGFSQFLDEAAERHLALLKAREIVDDHIARHGDFTDQELAEAEAAWHGG